MSPSDSSGVSAGEEGLLPRKELVLYRILGLLGAVTITALGWIHRVVDAATMDPLWERALVAAVCLGAAGLSFVHRTSTFRNVVYGVYYVVTAWVLHLLLLNDLSIDYALSIFIVVPAISVAFHTRRQLAVYLGLVVAGVAGVVLLVRDPAMAGISGLLYLTDVAVVCLLLFILVSSRLRTEKRLAESKERYELAARGARDGLWDWDLASDRIYFSARWMGTLGLPEEARDDKDPKLWLSRVHPDDRPRLENEVAAARDGDIAMYRSKREGPGQFEVFDKAMHDEPVRRLELERELRSSLDQDGLLLRYQPIISVSDGKLLGFEALLRWPHPERDVMGPEEFLGIAEETGLMGPIGAWVLEEACATLGRWRAEDDALADISMAVNISPHQILKSDLPGSVQELLERTGIPPDRLELEVTEGAVMADPERAREVLRSLRNLGVRVSIDDFGTGYSSLAYLKQFPVSTLKIDRSFVRHLDSSEQDRAMVRSVISLARALGVRALAEGVERQAQLEGLPGSGG